MLVSTKNYAFLSAAFSASCTSTPSMLFSDPADAPFPTHLYLLNFLAGNLAKNCVIPS